MIAFFGTLLRFFLKAFRSKGNILSESVLLKKQNEILTRRVWKKRVHFNINHLAYNLESVRTQVQVPNMKDWVEKKVRRHLMRARNRKGFGWQRWSGQWLYATLGMFNQYLVQRREPMVKAVPAR
jgi:hypothetical protein